MSYQTTNDLPHVLRDTLPPAAQEVYLQAYNDAWDSYDESTHHVGEMSRDGVAHQVGWAAVTKEFEHDEKTGQWYRQGEKPPEEEAEEGLMDKIKNLFS